MLMAPKRMLQQAIIKSRLSDFPLEVAEDGSGQIQQAGFDVRIDKIYALGGHGSLLRNSKKIAQYQELPCSGPDQTWNLKSGAYPVDCIEEVEIPIGWEGKVIHRSVCNRNGVLFFGSVYDPGYKGLVGGTLYINNPFGFTLQRGARIGQFQLQDAMEGTAYNGDFQNQKSHTQTSDKVLTREI